MSGNVVRPTFWVRPFELAIEGSRGCAADVRVTSLMFLEIVLDRLELWRHCVVTSCMQCVDDRSLTISRKSRQQIAGSDLSDPAKMAEAMVPPGALYLLEAEGVRLFLTDA
jgi:hypothetical protein